MRRNVRCCFFVVWRDGKIVAQEKKFNLARLEELNGEAAPPPLLPTAVNSPSSYSKWFNLLLSTSSFAATHTSIKLPLQRFYTSIQCQSFWGWRPEKIEKLLLLLLSLWPHFEPLNKLLHFFKLLNDNSIIRSVLNVPEKNQPTTTTVTARSPSLYLSICQKEELKLSTPAR